VQIREKESWPYCIRGCATISARKPCRNPKAAFAYPITGERRMKKKAIIKHTSRETKSKKETAI